MTLAAAIGLVVVIEAVTVVIATRLVKGTSDGPPDHALDADARLSAARARLDAAARAEPDVSRMSPLPLPVPGVGPHGTIH
jgi:hypothetical protein